MQICLNRFVNILGVLSRQFYQIIWIIYLICTHLTFDLIPRLRSISRLRIHPFGCWHTSRNTISMDAKFYLILPAKMKIKSKKIRNDQNLYNQIPHPALKSKREITKYINWQQFTKGTRGKPNEQLFPKLIQWSFSYLKFTKYVANIIAEPKYKYGQQEQVTVRNHNRSTALERSVLKYCHWGA